MSLGEPERLVVLPDNDSAARLAEASRFEVLLSYSSGRPLVLGSAEASRRGIYETRDRSILLLGTIPPRMPRTIIDQLLVASTARDVDTMLIPGSFYAVVRVGNTVRVQGSLSGLRRVFWARTDAGLVVADDASWLAAFAQADVSLAGLTRWMVSPHAPHPLSNLTAFSGVRAVAPGRFLYLDAGAGEEIPYWPSSRAGYDAEEGVRLLADRIDEAVALRCSHWGTVTCDVSGGIDSSVVVALAACHRPSVVAFTTGPPSLYAQEREWAEEVVRHAGVDRWVGTGPDNFPQVFDDIDVSYFAPDQPFAGEPVKARSAYIARELARATTSGPPIVHLTGHLGDEIFSSGTAHLRDLWRLKPREARRRLNLHNSLTRAPRSTLWRWMISGGTYEQAYRRLLRTGVMPLGWTSLPVHAPPWLRPGALRDLAVVADTSGHATHLGRTAEQHEALSRVVSSCDLLRHEAKLMAENGVFLEVPFGDDRVLDAALNLPVGALHDPSSVKPILRQCFPGLLPPSVGERSTKIDNTEAIWRGLRANRDRVSELTKDMQLERLGAIETTRFREALLGPHPPGLAPISLWRTLSVEVWLRDRVGSRQRA